MLSIHQNRNPTSPRRNPKATSWVIRTMSIKGLPSLPAQSDRVLSLCLELVVPLVLLRIPLGPVVLYLTIDAVGGLQLISAIELQAKQALNAQPQRRDSRRWP